ncbi:hypothetical protein ABPG75_001159 [Micractinium tetrahymenae]
MALRKLHGALGSRLLGLQLTCGTSTGGQAAVGSPAFFLAQRGFQSSSALFDFYSVLGVSRDASDSEIKKKYYQLAKKYHPDTNQGDPEAAKKFQEVQRAYDTLRDPQKRQTYDGMGHAAYENMEATGGAPGGGPGGPFPGGGFQVDPDELFREFFGGGRGAGAQYNIFEQMFGGAARGGFGGARTRPRPILRTAMRVSFEEAVKGTSKLVDLSSLGIPGLGKKTVEVNIPPGVDSGFQLRLEGVVPASQGMPAGDLLVNIAVAPSPVFQRDNFDLYVDVPIDMVDACLGTSVDVPTMDGTAEVKIKPGTQPGDKLRMRGYGVKMDVVGQRGRRGDQYVQVVVRIPRSLTAEQRRLLEEYRSAGKGGSSKRSGSSASSSGSGSGSSGASGSAGSGGESGGGSSSGKPSSSESKDSKGQGDSGGGEGQDSGSGEEGSGKEEKKEKKKRRPFSSWFS